MVNVVYRGHKIPNVWCLEKKSWVIMVAYMYQDALHALPEAPPPNTF